MPASATAAKASKATTVILLGSPTHRYATAPAPVAGVQEPAQLLVSRRLRAEDGVDLIEQKTDVLGRDEPEQGGRR